jgi:hypothetical protein
VSAQNNNYDSRSVNDGYIPDVINIKKGLYVPDLSGEYLVYVKGKTFASYSIYYYTHKVNDDKSADFAKNKTSIVNLEAGKIIKGYIKEEVGKINYKIYSFNPKLLPESNPVDLRISLTPEHSEYDFYCLFDYTNLNFKLSNPDILLTEYIWKSEDNEIIIKKNHAEYKKNSNYYIVIVPKHDYYSFNDKNSTNSTNACSDCNDSIDSFNSLFYIGFTTEYVPYVIKEGIPSSVTLYPGYESQKYWFYHYNISEPIDISLNVYYGRVDIYIDLWWSEDISNSETAIKALDTDSNFIKISPEKILDLLNRHLNDNPEQRSNSDTVIPFYIMVKKSSLVNASYLLAIKSESSMPEKLHSEIIRSDSILTGETKRYFFHVRKTDQGILNLNFRSGYGNIYMNIYQSDEKEKSQDYPTKNNHQFEGKDYLRGKEIDINDEILSRCAASCKVLISVVGDNLGISMEKIEYSLTFYKNILKLNQNQPFHGNVDQGEMKFFRVNFGKGVKNAYISLTNMNGDADLYVKYGRNLPTYENYNWSSSTSRNEFIEFDKNDNFFALTNLDDISGDYTIMVSGFYKSTFTIYVSSHPKKIVPLNNDSPASCITKEKNQYCYFRYDDVYNYHNVITETVNSGKENIQDLDLVINTHFYYGTGSIFAKLYDDTDYDILTDFPDENNFDYSNILGNHRNFLEIEINKENKKYNSNSTLLISVKCQDKCFFDLYSSKQYDSTVKYLNERKENTYFLHKAQKEFIFIYRINRFSDILVNMKALKGYAEVTLFTNSTSLENGYPVEQILEKFTMNSDNKDSNHIIKKLLYYKLNKNGSLYFKVLALTKFAFVLKLTYPHDWQEIRVGQTDIYPIDSISKKFYGSINFEEAYDHLTLTISTNNKYLNAYAYVKYIVYDKDEIVNKNNPNYETKKINTHILPNELDHDYKADNLNIYSLITMRLPKLDKEKIEKKIVKALFSVQVYDHSIERDIKDIKIKVNVSPQANNVTISKIPENCLHYVSVEEFENYGSIHVYELNKVSKNDNILILETSSCKGAIDVLVSPRIIHTKEDAVKFSFYTIHPASIDFSNGKTSYIFKNIESDNLYLMIKGKKYNDNTCEYNSKEDNYICRKSEALIKYIYTSDKNLKVLNVNAFNRGASMEFDIINSNSVLLKWNPLKTIAEKDDFFDSKNLENINNKKVEYKIYMTSSKEDFNYMDSLCYLNQLSKKEITGYNLKIEGNKYTAEVKKLNSGKPYYLNVLGKDLITNEIYAYKSLEIVTREDEFPPFLIGKFILFAFYFIYILIIVIFLFINNYIINFYSWWSCFYLNFAIFGNIFL